MDHVQEENDEHLDEEEEGPIPMVAQHVSALRRQELGRAFGAFCRAHPQWRMVDTSQKDPKAYIKEHLEG